MKKKILVPLAEGFEMIEALAVVDVFRRASVSVDIAAIGGQLAVTSSHQVVVQADTLIEQCEDQEYDLIVLPGGIPGAENLKKSKPLEKLLKRQHQQDKFFAAICAAPAVVLQSHGLLEGKKATCHPMFLDELSSQEHGRERVVIDGKCVTSRGAGTAIEFGLELLGILCGEDKKNQVATQMAIA
jgi:4-methyl-5(b-hydroxyethyl)-thiazole monophosphate biosynthesis